MKYLPVFALFVLMLVPSAEAQHEFSDEARTAAQWNAVVPGAGHIYAGDPAKGAMLFAGVATPLAFGYFLSDFEPCEGPSCFGREDINHTPMYAGAAMAASVYILGIMDAAREVDQSSAVSARPAVIGSRPGVAVSVSW